jgi:hypothetical protein
MMTGVIRFVTDIIMVYDLLDKVTVNLQFLLLIMSFAVALLVGYCRVPLTAIVLTGRGPRRWS